MPLRTKLIVYLCLLHLVLAVAAAFALLDAPVWIFAVEALFLVSIVLSVRLVRALFAPVELVRTGAELIAERDFTSRFTAVGQPDLDALVDVYNRMIDRLREERLAAEEHQKLLAKIVEASPAGIVIRDFDGGIEQVNPAAQRLMTADVEREMAAMAPGESRMIAGAGARRLRVACAEFRDRGFAKRFHVIEEMTEELRLSEKAAFEKLIRMMSHEVNNSVGAVRSLLESALRYAPQVGEADRDDFTSALTIASSRVDALNRFMTEFADVVRIPPPRIGRAPLAPLVERIAALLRPELESRGMSLSLAVEDRRPFAIDEAQMEQVVLNVLRNAMEAAGRDGTIRVSLAGGVLSISDSGPGIADAVRSQLFTPFFTTKRDGRGLGLTIVQEILANHGFAFSLANRAGGGAEFRVEVGGRIEN